jgi:GDPmannose 4,6-dehydratase
MQWLMLQQEEPEDFVIATGVQHSVREFTELAAAQLGMELRWEGSGQDERGYDQNGRCVVKVDPTYFRPTEVDTLLGDATRAREKLGWEPSTSFSELVAEMMEYDFKAAQLHALAQEHGFDPYQRS